MIALLRHSSYIATRSLRHSWKRSALLAIVLGVSLGLPVALTTLLAQASTDMRARAAVSPLLLGARGSEADLVFGTLFFAAQPARGLAMRDLARAARACREFAAHIRGLRATLTSITLPAGAHPDAPARLQES